MFWQQNRSVLEKPHFFISSNSNLFFIAQEKKWFIVRYVIRGKNLLWGKVFFFGITNKHAFYLVHFEENLIFKWSLFPRKFAEESAENSFSMLWGELIASATNRWNVLARSLRCLYLSLMTKNFREQRNFRVIFLDCYANWKWNSRKISYISEKFCYEKSYRTPKIDWKKIYFIVKCFVLQSHKIRKFYRNLFLKWTLNVQDFEFESKWRVRLIFFTIIFHHFWIFFHKELYLILSCWRRISMNFSRLARCMLCSVILRRSERCSFIELRGDGVDFFVLLSGFSLVNCCLKEVLEALENDGEEAEDLEDETIDDPPPEPRSGSKRSDVIMLVLGKKDQQTFNPCLVTTYV